MLLAFFSLIGYAVFAKTWIAAGATWLQNRDAWVNTYELTSINLKASGTNLMLRLCDSAGQKVESLPLSQAQRNQALWDLAYNGILHSVVIGKADPPTKVRTILKLPGGKGQPPAGS